MEKIKKGILAVISEVNADDAASFIISLLRQHAVGFAEWIGEKYTMASNGMWYEVGSLEWEEGYTTADLYEHYLKYLKEKEDAHN